MSFDLSSIQRNAAAASVVPPRILIYSAEGMGKTTFCAEAPDVIFIPTEDGLGNLDVASFPLAQTFDQVIEACATLYNEQHPYRSLALDSLDHLELLIWDKVCAGHDVKAIGDIPYGRGFEEAMNHWRLFFQWLTALRDHKGMLILATAHSTVQKFEAPDRDSYDRYEIKLHKKAKDFVKERFDCVLFANHNPVIRKEESGFGKKRAKIVTSERVIYTADRPAATAKNRYNLPEMLPLSWGAFAEALSSSAGSQEIQKAGGRELDPELVTADTPDMAEASDAPPPPPRPTKQKAPA